MRIIKSKNKELRNNCITFCHDIINSDNHRSTLNEGKSSFPSIDLAHLVF